MATGCHCLFALHYKAHLHKQNNLKVSKFEEPECASMFRYRTLVVVMTVDRLMNNSVQGNAKCIFAIFVVVVVVVKSDNLDPNQQLEKSYIGK